MEGKTMCKKTTERSNHYVRMKQIVLHKNTKI